MISNWQPSRTLCSTPELIENYDKAVADKTQVWECHHILETHNSDGERRLVDLTMDELKALDMYYNRPPEELIFMTSSEHQKLHNTGKHLSEEARRKVSMSLIGNCHMTGKHHTEEARHKMSISHKRKVVVCIETGVVYSSTREAERQTGIHHGNISSVCKGKTKTAGGFHWRYE